MCRLQTPGGGTRGLFIALDTEWGEIADRADAQSGGGVRSLSARAVSTRARSVFRKHV